MSFLIVRLKIIRHIRLVLVHIQFKFFQQFGRQNLHTHPTKHARLIILRVLIWRLMDKRQGNKLFCTQWQKIPFPYIWAIPFLQDPSSRGLRRRSTAVRPQRSWVRIPMGHGCLSVVSVVCCQVEVSATDWSLVQRSPTDCGSSLCVIKKPRTRGGYSPARGLQNTNHNGL